MKLIPIEFDPFRHGEISHSAPCTAPQEEVLASSLFSDSGNAAFNEALTLEISGQVKASRIESSLNTIVRRHEALRSSFASNSRDYCVAKPRPFQLEIHNFEHIEKSQQKIKLAELEQSLVKEVMDIIEGQLFRAIFISFNQNESALILLAHHIVCDGWSFHVILEELSALYSLEGEGEGEEHSLPEAPSFSEFTERQKLSQISNSDEQYWQKIYADRPPIVDLPTDQSRPALRSFDAARLDYPLNELTVKSITSSAGQLRASKLHIMLAGLAILIQRLSGQRDIVIGLPVARQNVDDLPTLVGHCVQLLPLRIHIQEGLSFTELVAQVKNTTLDAYDHYDFTFGSLIRSLGLSGDASRVPISPVMFNIDQAFAEFNLGETKVKLRSIPRAAENFELFLNVVPEAEQLTIETTFNTRLFKTQTITSWLNGYEALLQNAQAQPTRLVDELSLCTKRPEIYARFNATAKPVFEKTAPEKTAPDTWLEHLFNQTRLHANKTAVVDKQGELSYTELTQQTLLLAEKLLEQGIKPGQLVGIHLNRDRQLIIAIAAIHLIGAAYVPLDPAFPKARLEYMVDDCTPELILCAQTDNQIFDKSATLCLPLQSHLLDAHAAKENSVEACRLVDACKKLNASQLAQRAYIIYTSGSSGKPKGVALSQSNLSNFLSSFLETEKSSSTYPQLKSEDKLLAITTLSFDISILELLLPIASGATVVIADESECKNGSELCQLIAKHKITALQATPSSWRMLLNAGFTIPLKIQSKTHLDFLALCGGEPLPSDLASELLKHKLNVWNMYGPTETTIWSSCAKVEASEAPPSIGLPLFNTEIYLLDDALNLVPAGIPGEICIGGAGLAIGYYNREQLTAEKFIQHPTLGRIYRTGDLGKLSSELKLFHLGRIDAQVKLRGFRIELEEIEAQLNQHHNIAQSAVSVWKKQAGDERLVAYYKTSLGFENEGFENDEFHSELKNHLKANLPNYMVPQHFLAIDDFPCLPNGKLDRSKLNTIDTGFAIDKISKASGSYPLNNESLNNEPLSAKPLNDRQSRLKTLASELLGHDGLSIDDDFFALGGHSLLASQYAFEINKAFDIQLSMQDVFLNSSIRFLSCKVDEQIKKDKPDSALSLVRQEHQSSGPATSMQARLWQLEQLNPGKETFHLPSAHRLTGPLNEKAFQQAFDLLISQQPSLRTFFREVNGSEIKNREANGTLEQHIKPHLSVDLFPAETIDASSPDDAQTMLLASMYSLISKPFNFTESPLFQVKLFRLSAYEHVLFFMPHHLIWDGWSFDIFDRELSYFYECFSANKTTEPVQKRISYIDYAHWHNKRLSSAALSEQKQAWYAYLSKAKPAKALPTDRKRQALASGLGQTEWLELDSDVLAALQQLAKDTDATVSTVILACYTILIAGFSKQYDIAIGMPIRNRHSPELEQLAGFFNTLLPLHFSVDPAKNLTSLIALLQAHINTGFSFSELPLEALQYGLNKQHRESKSELYQALYSFQDARNRVESWGALTHEPIHLFQRMASEDLGLWIMETRSGAIGGFTYNTNVFEQQTIRALVEAFYQIIQQAISNTDTSIAEITLNCVPPHSAVNNSAVNNSAVNDMDEPAAGTPVTGNVPFTEAETDLQRSLVYIWENILGVDKIGIDDDFFELGGNSLRLLQMTAEIKKSSGVNIALAVAFTHTSIRNLSECIASDQQVSTSVVVPLNSAKNALEPTSVEVDASPLFCLAGISIYSPLAKNMHASQPVYGVHVSEEHALINDVMEKGRSNISINELVSAYYDAIKRFCPIGPYKLAGLSFGGLLAIEVASRLRKNGDIVENVFLLDTLLAEGYRYKQNAKIKTIYARSKLTLIDLASKVASNLSFLGSLKASLRIFGSPKRSEKHIAKIRRHAYFQLIGQWQSQRFENDYPVTLFKAQDNSDWGDHIVLDENYGWLNYLSPEQFDVIQIEGDHLGILQEPNVLKLAQHISNLHSNKI